MSPDTPSTLSPRVAWRLCAHLLAGRPRMRVAETRTKRLSYPHRLEQPLVEDPPSVPTAVHVYDQRGNTRMIPFDLDAHERTEEQAAAVSYDLQALTSLFDEIGATYLVDGAHGGSHVYLLLADPLTADDARTLVLALQKRLPTLDAGPTRSASDGLITIPGSAHRYGGYRTLLSPIDAIHRVGAGERTPRRAVRALRLHLANEMRELVDEDRRRGDAQREARRETGQLRTLQSEEPLSVTQRGIGRHMSAKLAELAQDGDWRLHGYPSPSEGRRAVLMSAIATGLLETDIRQRMLSGAWPGLRSLFDHKGLHRLPSEYASAWEEIRGREAAGAVVTRGDSADVSDTSATTHRGAASVADPHGTIRTWRCLVYDHGAHELPGARGWKYQQVLRALAAAAHMNGSPDSATGIRWISVATGYSIETVALALRELSAAKDPWIERTEQAHGIHANRYALRVPRRHADAADRVRWVRGRAHAIRPVFTVLGTPAALVYEAAEHGRSGSYAQLMLRTGLGRDAVRAAVSVLTSWNLIDSDRDGGWHLTSTDADLERLAEQLGAISTRVRRLTRYREQRQKYWQYLEEQRVRRPWVVHVRNPDTAPPPDVEAMLQEMRLADTG